MKKARMKTPKDTYTIDYPNAIETAEKQMAILWFAEELGVEKDENDVRTKMTEGERYGLTTVLRLFTKYELHIGDDWWSGKFSRMFPRPDIRRMANAFSFMEINVHAPFYNLINTTLNIATDEFYDSWKDSEVLTERVEFIEDHITEKDDYLALAAFAFMEGVVLFSSFAFLKSFNVGGYNIIPHIVSGIDASAKDEDFHCMATAWAYRQLDLEENELGLLDDYYKQQRQQAIYNLAQEVYEHEKEIVKMIFSKGGIRTITEEEILHFIRNRIDLVLRQLNLEPMYKEQEGVVTEWFYDHLNSYKYSDFFSNAQVQYVRNWNKSELAFGQ
jgi:ribonucleotide reductase beta subunit family protein with ferritin-like domain